MEEGFLSRDFEEPYLGLPRDGSVLITAGSVAIVLAAIPACYLYDGYRVGSNFCLIWTLVQGGIGLLMAVIGFHMERDRDLPEDPASERWILSEETTP